MADKLGSGAWHDGPARRPAVRPRNPQEEERLAGKRDNARWSAVVGFIMLFAASFSVGFAVGGVLMILYGASASIYWSRRLAKLKGDPWDYDPDLDGPDPNRPRM